MKSAGIPSHSQSPDSPKEYWSGLGDHFNPADTSGFTPVLHPNAPIWFNRSIDTLQYRAFRRALAMAGVPSEAEVLDVGCGTGRWLRRYEELGYHATGIDSTASMLRVARQLKTNAPLVLGEAYRLPFPNARFDLVSDITVVQHISASLQPQALAEIVRVIRPGGRLILMELIQGDGPLLFPRSPADWIGQTESCGIKLIGWFGQEYRLIDRLFVLVALTLSGRNEGSLKAAAAPREGVPEKSAVARRIYWGIRRVTVPISEWVDPVADWICPGRFATHGVFVFQK
jgi:SAM-dependent methyltransferase